MNNSVQFDFFTRKIDYFISQGKGFSLFNSSQEIWQQFFQICNNNNISNSVYYCSKIETGLGKLEPHSIAIIIQDLPLSEFQAKAAFIADKLVFPLWYEKRAICFFSILDKSEYQRKNISSSDIHSRYQVVIDFLLLEQINNLLTFSNIQFSSPEFLSLSQDKTIFTPIEKIMSEALEKEKLSFTPQVHIGRYFVDFIVSIENQKIIVECDGREFHDPIRDAERDKVLGLENYPILRFSGSQIVRDIEGCIKKIKSSSKNNSRSNYKLDDDLDEDQDKSTKFISGPVRVLAPAGSGKTKTLINRIANLINNGVDQEKILALAFNKKAQEEMQGRLEAKQITEVAVRTFHSLGNEIIRDDLGWRFEVKSEKKTTRDLLQSAVAENIQLPKRRNKDPLSEFLEALRKAKMELPILSKMEVEIEDKIVPFESIFNNYLKKQTGHNFYNFDDMIYLAVRSLLDNDALRHEYQTKYEYVLVDEYQDLNKAQLLFLQILSLPQTNVFVVGDDDQMIYGWRGAEVRNIVDFHKRFTIIQDCVLSTNYRSSKNIVRHSRWLIDHNFDRVKKNIHAAENAEEGIFEIQAEDNLWEQAQVATQWITRIKNEHNLKWRDFAVLFRYNAFEYIIAIALDKASIPHTPVGNVRLFQSAVGKDIFSYLAVILYPDDATKDDYSRILARPNKYLTNELISEAKNWSALQNLPNRSGLRGWEVEKLTDFIDRTERLRERTKLGIKPGDLISAISTEFGLTDFYIDQSKNNEDLDTASDDIMLDVIQSLAFDYKDSASFYQMIYKARSDDDGTDNQEKQQRDEITLSSIHRAKGKEFECTVYFNLSPDKRKKTTIDIEEERRVAYVGVTRAKKRILITFLKDQPSPFVKEMALNPKFINMIMVTLRSSEATLKIELSKTENDLKLLEQQKSNISNSFPEIHGGELKLPTSFSIFSRIKLWIYQKQLERAFKKYKILEEKATNLTNEKFKPQKENIYQIQSEIEYRNKIDAKIT